MNRIIMSSMIAFAAIMGCAGPMGINADNRGGSSQGGSGGASSATTTTTTGTTTIATDSGLPCDVAMVLSSLCTSCHSNPPTTGTPMPLLSYANLTAQKNGVSYAQLSVDRMSSASSPMPPSGGATAADIAVLQAWIDQGLPMGACGDVDAGPPDPTFQGDPTCESGNYFVPPPDVEDAKTLMYPGQACIQCHKKNGEGPQFSIAGTVFATGKVLDDCLPPATVNMALAKVVITDANNVEHPLTVNKNGNFATQIPIAFPYKARVTYDGKERAMSGAQTDGDCNKCHTEAGAQNAPGRIALPM